MPSTNAVLILPSDAANTGKDLQAFSNTVGGNTVYSEGVTLVRSSDNTEIGTSIQPVRTDPTGTTVQPTANVANDLIDTNNSYFAPPSAVLGAGGAFTGTGTLTTGYSQLIVAVDTDQPSAATSTTGLFVQWSEDNTNWGDADGGSFSSSDSGLGQGYSYPIKRKYYRVVYTNGATPQTYFRLQSILKVNTGVGRLIDLIDTIDPNSHAQVIRNRGFGASAYGGGTFNDEVVKNPSTVAAATDPALVVAISPNGSGLAATGASVPAYAAQAGNAAATALPTAVTGGQLVAPMADVYGRPAVLLNAPRALVGSVVVSNNSAASAQSFIGSGGAGVYTDITTFIATNRSATATIVSLTDGTLTYTFSLAGNGGIVVPFPTPLPASSVATAWTIGNSATVACDYIAVYHKTKAS